MENVLNSIRNRPRFKILTSLGGNEFLELLKKASDKNADYFKSNINKAESYIEIKTLTQPYWKPRLSLRFEEEEGKHYIRGMFGPNPIVWTFVMFLYILFGTLFVFFGTFYASVINTKTSDFQWTGIVALLSFIGILILFISIKIQQKRAKPEMKMLRKFAEDLLDTKE